MGGEVANVSAKLVTKGSFWGRVLGVRESIQWEPWEYRQWESLRYLLVKIKLLLLQKKRRYFSNFWIIIHEGFN